MDDLKAWYRERLAARIDALEAARRALATEEESASGSIRRLAHSLRGSGGTFGYPEVTRAAAAVEDADRSVLELELQNLLQTLREAVNRSEARRFAVLVIDDDPLIPQLLQDRLAGPTREVWVARTGAAAEVLLDTTEVSLVLLDLSLPDMDGRTLLCRIRERSRTAGLPVFVISGVSTPQTRTECFALGADEFFGKPFDPDTLSAAVAGKLERAAGLSLESRQDALTGMPNRPALREAFERARSGASRARGIFSLAILDFDHFKSVNDTFGHKMGDDVLRRASARIAGALRGSDTLGRWGGEEFVMLFPGSSRRAAARATERALLAVRAEAFETTRSDDVFHVSFSAGVVEVPPESTLEEAVDAADRLLYIAKSSGRARVVASDDPAEEPPARILVAEDDPEVAAAVERHLRGEGFEVVCVPDGAAAMATAPSANIALAIIDVKLPIVNGFDLLTHLRRQPSLARTPILILTALDSEVDVARAFELGADDYVVKPFHPLELRARVRRLISRP